MSCVSSQLINALRNLLNKKNYKSITVSNYVSPYVNDCINYNMLNFFYNNNIIFDRNNSKYIICEKYLIYNCYVIILNIYKHNNIMIVDISLTRIIKEKNKEFLKQLKNVFVDLQKICNCEIIYLSFYDINEYYILYSIIKNIKYFSFIFIDFYYIKLNDSDIKKIFFNFNNNIIRYRLLRYSGRPEVGDVSILKNQYYIFTEVGEIIYTNKIISKNCIFNELLYLFIMYLR